MTSTFTSPGKGGANGPALEEGLQEDHLSAPSRESSVASLRVLWNRRRFLARATLLGLFVATLGAFLLPKRYQSSGRLMPPDSQAGSAAAMLSTMTARTGGGFGLVAGDLLGLKSSGALFVGILDSETVRNRLTERFGLKKVYGVRLNEDSRKVLAQNTIISEDRKSGIITITVSDKSAPRAAAMTNAYVEELNRLVAELTTSAAHIERVFLEERLKQVKQDLDNAAEQFGQFASKNTAIDIDAQGKAMVGAAATLQGQLIAAQSELEGLKQVYTDSNVRVRAVHARIGELHHQLEKFGGKDVSEADGASRSGDTLYPTIRKLPLLGVTYADLLRRTKIQEVVYETLTQQYELAKVQEAKETPSVKVLDPASVPERKSFPPRLLIMFLGTFFSLAWAVAWALGRGRWEETDAQDPRKVFAQEVFATVMAEMPWASQNGSRLHAMTSRIWSRLSRPGKPPEQ